MNTGPMATLVGADVGDGKYHLIQALGAGAFGTVFRAGEQLDGHQVREVALKVYSPKASEDGNVEGMLADCTLPARVLASDAPPYVKRHFAQIYDFGYLSTPIGRCAFVAMELIRGAQTLDDLMSFYRSSGRFPRAEQVEGYMVQLFTALDAAHTAGVLHRDIKGANVMLDSGVIRVMDFGVGAFLARPDTPIRTTRSIMAPENFEGRHSAASDIYQAGLLFYQLYTGIDPFAQSIFSDDSDDDLLRRSQFQPRRGASVPGVNASGFLDAILARCLVYTELARYGSAREVLQALDHSDTVSTAKQAAHGGDPAQALLLAEEALADPNLETEKRITALSAAGAAHLALNDLDPALAHYREARLLAESSGALFHQPSEYNSLLDAEILIHTKRGQAGLARLLQKKRTR